jgi:two-component system, cell cycle response regulator
MPSVAAEYWSAAHVPSAIPVLLIEDDSDYSELVHHLLDGPLGELPDLQFSLVSATTLTEGLARLSRDDIKVVLLDLTLPDSTGLQTLARVRHEAPDVAVVVLTGAGDPAWATQALQEGAQDYLLKHETDERSLVRSLRYSMERQRLLATLASLSLTDDLTHLHNRRGFFTLAERQWTLAERQNSGLSLVFADLDGLKEINDRHGHQEGDRALTTTARLLLDVCREADIAARLGGDEFGLMLVGADENTGPEVVERLEQSVRQLHRQQQQAYVLSFSVGLAHHAAGTGGSLDSLVAEADANMYECKRLRQSVRLRRA